MIVAGKDVRKIDNEFLITVVPILDHTGPLATAFPVENRLTGQTFDELRVRPARLLAHALPVPH